MYITNTMYGTTPLIVHAPGLLHSMDKIMIHTLFNPYWIPIIKNWQKEAPKHAKRK